MLATNWFWLNRRLTQEDSVVIARLLDDFARTVDSLVEMVPCLYAGGLLRSIESNATYSEALVVARARLVVLGELFSEPPRKLSLWRRIRAYQRRWLSPSGRARLDEAEMPKRFEEIERGRVALEAHSAIVSEMLRRLSVLEASLRGMVAFRTMAAQDLDKLIGELHSAFHDIRDQVPELARLSCVRLAGSKHRERNRQRSEGFVATIGPMLRAGARELACTDHAGAGEGACS